MKKYLSVVFCLFVFAGLNVFGQSSSLLGRNSSSDDISATLPISVTLGGEFLITGTFPAYTGERVDQFVTRTFSEASTQIQYPVNNAELFLRFTEKSKDYALRGIKLIRKNGQEVNIDLLKFRLTGDFTTNPYLMNDDVIIFPEKDLEYDFVEISGAVNKPVKFRYVEGDKLSDAICFARGVNEAYENINKAIISRLSYDGQSEEQITVGVNEEFELKRGDRIKVVADKTERKSYKILVLGEVRQPGYVFITKDNTTLKEAIDKAGGFTENASLKDANLMRNYDQEQILKKYALEKQSEEDPSLSVRLLTDDKNGNYFDQLEMLKMWRSSNFVTEDSISFLLDNQLRLLERNNLVDFTGLDSANSSASKFIVRDGDVITVPEKFDAVYVFGQVAKTGYYKFEQGKNYKYYIDSAGGLTASAKDDDDIYIIKGNTREWISVEEKGITIEAGDYIYVVKKLRYDMWTYIKRISSVAGILGSIATIILVIQN